MRGNPFAIDEQGNVAPGGGKLVSCPERDLEELESPLPLPRVLDLLKRGSDESRSGGFLEFLELSGFRARRVFPRQLSPMQKNPSYSAFYFKLGGGKRAHYLII